MNKPIIAFSVFKFILLSAYALVHGTDSWMVGDPTMVCKKPEPALESGWSLGVMPLKGILVYTHLKQEGARQVAGLFVEDVKAQQLPLVKFFNQPSFLPSIRKSKKNTTDASG
ncbi:hypothetical protein [Cesiribacter sp. SM1]|uniref:hypothetical protein n=1 Tax=Cesiribacter sp. SM1 TaxID=2861196 RepID=UPI001CD36CA4|nr:hypothetical protein [Cesiribacter sp. SM1]